MNGQNWKTERKKQQVREGKVNDKRITIGLLLTFYSFFPFIKCIPQQPLSHVEECDVETIMTRGVNYNAVKRSQPT